MTALTQRRSRMALSEVLRVSTLPDAPAVYRSGVVAGLADLFGAVTPGSEAAPGTALAPAPAGELRQDGNGAIAQTGPLIVRTPMFHDRRLVSPAQFRPVPIVPPGQIIARRPSSAPAVRGAAAAAAAPVVAQSAGTPSHATTALGALLGAAALFL